MAALAALAAVLAAWGRAPTAALLAGLGAVAAAAGLWRFVDRGNAELARFVRALERGDLSQTFARPLRGAGFEQVGAAFEQAMARLRAERAGGAAASRFAEALADGAPAALLVADDRSLHFSNKAARRLFNRADPCSLDELHRYGASFARAVAEAGPGPSRLAHLALGGGGPPQRVAVDATLVELPGQGARRVLSVKVIQAELDGAELAAQVDLVRVLSHEIMNSLTPVTSLAQTAAAAVAAVDAPGAPGLEDARLATTALARRAAGLERFVASYRDFSRAPVVRAAPLDLAPWLAEMVRLFRGTPAGEGAEVTLHLSPAPPAALPPVRADAGLLAQVMLNLLKNAGEAAAGATPRPRVEVALRPVEAPGPNGLVQITVRDNGPGIPDALVDEVFLPFFTTKSTGTGIGLSFARQVALLHGGRIGVGPGPGGRIDLLLPLAPPH